MTFTALEQEAIVLNAVMGMVDDMVNHTIFCLPGEKTENTNLLPQTSGTLRQFAILLRDFLSTVAGRGKGPMPFGLPRPPNGDNATDNTTLFYLARVCKNPLIGTNVDFLEIQTHSFIEWLECSAVVPNVWLANIEVEVNLTIKRIDFIRMGGDIGKHNFLRLGGQAARLRKILGENGVTINESQAYAALPDCWDWFHTHLFAYHASTIAEFLNNIRYAIRLYVTPTAKSSYRVTGKIDDYIDRYTFDRPTEIKNEFAWAQYCELLNSTRHKPNFPFFSVTQSLKSQF
ncbi:hypothetical protein [Natronohydrobacter thiooxidans]|uniref:hypothetical protein n=1 Tax=Natronohydrobacter thiooxidans TaxID=87172 RepID=UPI0008FF256F|nr:hypothetical protein [Natronohydrobacter thiooxidans]